MTEVDSRTLFEEVSIYRVSFCTNDSNYSKVFAFIARNNDNESMECHAFLCPVLITRTWSFERIVLKTS